MRRYSGLVMAVTRTRAKAQPRRIPVRGDSARRRQDHSQELAQDYVEMIAELIDKTGEARLTDLARGLGVTHVTANRTIKRLQRQGLVTSQPYRSIFLTGDGRSLAQGIARSPRNRRQVSDRAGCARSVAESDAEGHRASRQPRDAGRVRPASARATLAMARPIPGVGVFGTLPKCIPRSFVSATSN